MRRVTMRQAAETLWGQAGAFVHDVYQDRRALFDRLPDELPMVIGLTAYGHCVGLTRGGDRWAPRITISSLAFREGRNVVADIVVHEMAHVALILGGQDSAHNGTGWYRLVAELSPAVLGHDLNVARSPRRSVRIPNPEWEPGNGEPKTLVRKERVAGTELHGDVARWPGAFRPPSWDPGAPIDVATY